MNKKSIIIPISIFALTFGCYALADSDLSQKLAGRILLQVQSKGESWYINPADLRRYSLGKPEDAFNLIKSLGTGITDNNLSKISIGLLGYSNQDSDQDGLCDQLENALGTNPNNSDSDNDGYTDKQEIENNFDPSGLAALKTDKNFTNLHLGKIFIQTEKLGQAWYINPVDKKRYYLGKPADAFLIMKKFGLGITNINLSQIKPHTTPSAYEPPMAATESNQIISLVADAIRAGDTEKVLTYFTQEMNNPVEYTMNFLNAEQRLTLGNILSSAQLTSSDSTQKTYTAEVYFNNQKYPIKFTIKKQNDGNWLMINL